MAGFKIVIQKSGNVITEAEGFAGETCVTRAGEIMEALKRRGIGVHLDTFHMKDPSCEGVVHLADVLKSGK